MRTSALCCPNNSRQVSLSCRGGSRLQWYCTRFSCSIWFVAGSNNKLVCVYLFVQAPDGPLFSCVQWCKSSFVPACHILWLPASLRCFVRISLSAWLPSPPRRHLHAAGCPSSGPGCRGKRSGAPRSLTTGTLVKKLQLRSQLSLTSTLFYVWSLVQKDQTPTKSKKPKCMQTKYCAQTQLKVNVSGIWLTLRTHPGRERFPLLSILIFLLPNSAIND